MPFALVQLCLWPACLDSSEHAAVTITDNALGIAPGNEPRKALQLAGLALVNASVSQSLGLPATKPTPQKPSKATLPAGIPSHWGPGLALERADGRAAATLASARQSVGRAGTRPVQRPPPSRRATGHDSTRAARRSQYRTGSASPDLGSRERPACRCCRRPLLAAPPRFPGQRTGSGEAPWVLRVARAAARSVRTSCARTPPAAEAR